MAICDCRFYNGIDGDIHFTQDFGMDGRGNDLVGLPRNSEKNKHILSPYRAEITHACDGAVLGGDSWTWGLLVRARMLEGSHTGKYYLVGHLKEFYVKPGMVVEEGTVIATEGETGRAFGRHAHIELQDGWTPLEAVADLCGTRGLKPGQDYHNTYVRPQDRQPALAPGPVNPFPGVSDEELARRVWLGEFGNGADREAALGVRYASVQDIVNRGSGKPAPAGRTHTVVPGDTLWDIGRKYGVDWNTIYAVNKGVIGADPNLIYPGQVLIIP